MEHSPLIWMIDSEWEEHSLEEELLRQAFPQCEIRLTRTDFSGDLERFGQEADVILAQIDVVLSREVLARLNRCRGIAVFGSGYNNVDVSAAKELGIPVTNVNGYCAEDLADYVLAAVFHHYKRLTQFSSHISSGNWGFSAVAAPIHRLSAQTLFLLGYGYIGKVVARRAAALGMRVMVCDPYLPAEEIQKAGYTCVTLEEGLRGADFVSIHIRLSADTESSIGMDFFRQMKPSAVLINVSRGQLIREAELIDALNQGVIAGAVLDVVAHEPIAMDDPLLRAPNLLITPHISYASEEAVVDLRRRAVENAVAMLEGHTPLDLVRC